MPVEVLKQGSLSLATLTNSAPSSRRRKESEMNNIDDKGCKTPDADLLRMALEHYEKISMRACEWYSVIPRSIGFYFSYKNKIVLLERQRDAALKLAADFASYSDDASLHGLTGAASAFWQCAKELRLELTPKE